MFTLGCDPELFLVSADGQPRSSIGLVGGSKANPRPIGIGDGFAVQEDNVAIEFNIPPAATKAEWMERVPAAMKALEREVGMFHGLAFSDKSAIYFPTKELENPAALEFGCDPDYSAWEKGKRNPRPKATDATLRSAGGHVHVGYKFDSRTDVQEFIKYLDLVMGVPSILMDEGHLRKSLYGGPGAFRYKPYGCEYRTPSNFWVFKDSFLGWVWDATERALKEFTSKVIDVNVERETIIKAIKQNDAASAQSLVNKYSLQLA